MNEQAQQLLVDLIQKASNGIDGAVAFSQAQIPDVVHQLLMWNFTTSILYSAICISLFSGLQYLSFKIFKYLRKEWEGDDFAEYPEMMLLLILYALTFIPLLWVNLDWLKIWLAPKLYLIEYAASLVK